MACRRPILCTLLAAAAAIWLLQGAVQPEAFVAVEAPVATAPALRSQRSTLAGVQPQVAVLSTARQ
eukprot:CAMPEP_0168391948 /NCGR_PEP_ID=MMETSP0228-20121227/18247_1 /TAXON_ID=133427 /ORGANISM="Protoceratium reticulatum, Strain CCCM 535 (=CCMP 1889)" /LENGTH=65 /DNA_ID=CAMNT_0008405277 /DNA_START=66 /DNA_END=260 /DNA_ORIENTATION=+